MILEIKTITNITITTTNEKSLMLVIFVIFDNKSKRGNAEIIINAIDTNSSLYSFIIDIMLFVISLHSRLH
jgi:hypothetical protein